MKEREEIAAFVSFGLQDIVLANTLNIYSRLYTQQCGDLVFRGSLVRVPLTTCVICGPHLHHTSDAPGILP